MTGIHDVSAHATFTQTELGTAIHDAMIGLQPATSTTSTNAAPTQIGLSPTAMFAAHDAHDAIGATGAQSNTSTHSVAGAHDTFAHAELGTTTLHDTLTLHSTSFATQMHV
jgi:hypothetical protein